MTYRYPTHRAIQAAVAISLAIGLLLLLLAVSHVTGVDGPAAHAAAQRRSTAGIATPLSATRAAKHFALHLAPQPPTPTAQGPAILLPDPRPPIVEVHPR